MDTIKRSLVLLSFLFTLIILGLSIGDMLMDNWELALGGLDSLLIFLGIFLVVLAMSLSQQLGFRLKFLNYLSPYLLVSLILLGLVYLVNTYLVANYIELRLVLGSFTVFYLIYSLISLGVNKRKRRIEF